MRGNAGRLWSIALLVTAVGLLVDPRSALAAYTLYIAPTGSDSNSGLSPSQPLATIQRVNDLLLAADPNQNAFVKVAPGTYHCEGALWTYHNPSYPTQIEPLNSVPSPAVNAFDNPNRPVFTGKRADGTQCDGSVWLSVRHGHVRMRLTIRGMTVTYYRGGISLGNFNNTTTAINQEITIDNMFFDRIGDYYFPDSVTGKGAILSSISFGNTIENSYFRNVRNNETDDVVGGPIYALYFSGLSSRNVVNNNVFHAIHSSAIRISNYSNDNVFTNNGFSWVYGYVLEDRWCGALEDCTPQPGCPSWNTDFPIEENSFSNVAGRVKVYAIPAGQTCSIPPPVTNLRIDLGSEGQVFGSNGVTLP
jgi:hypothetical protein